MKIDIVFGTRPELIKLFPVIKALKENHSDVRVINTGQHREMLNNLLDWFGTKADVNLSVMRANNTLDSLTAAILTSLSDELRKRMPDLILVQGDTTTAFAAALAAFYLKIPIGHVEAGLRTFNRFSPWPEEINRTFITKIADLHFAPTRLSEKLLLNEGIAKEKIFLTGNTVIDSLLFSAQKVRDMKIFPKGLASYFDGDLIDHRVILITGHRRESFGEGFRAICHAIKELAENFKDVHFVYPVHLNPNVQRPVQSLLANASLPNLHLIEPLSYPEFVSLMERSYFILTDSGGVQEEAPSLGKPVLVMRENTERPEGIDSGCARLTGTTKEKIVSSAMSLLTNKKEYEGMTKASNPYGDGHAASRILNALLNHA